MNATADEIKENPLRFKACGKSDTGLRRPQNEDHLAVCTELGLWAVADGMGGHAAGEVASRTAIETLREFINLAGGKQDLTLPFGMDKNRDLAENVIMNGIQLANRKICQLAAENRDYSGMGTTLALIYAPDMRMRICHVGDSRVYRLRGARIELLTMDHSWVNEQLQRNILTEDEARNHRWRNVITRALGNRLDLEIDMKTVEAAPGDVFLVCTDGLTGMLRDEEIAHIVGERLDNLESACTGLIEAANRAGGQDNVTVIVIQVLD